MEKISQNVEGQKGFQIYTNVVLYRISLKKGNNNTRKEAVTMAGDLHLHSTFSDGALKAERLPILASRIDLSHIAITDHDSVRSVRYAYEHPIVDGVRLIPGTELTAFDAKRKGYVHLLCYWPDKDCPELAEHCRLMDERRNEVYLEAAKELEKRCPQFRLEDALEYAQDSGVLYKSTIMKVLYEYGLADGIYKETYSSIFGSKRGWVRKKPEYRTVEEVLDVVKKARGVVVFAHPSVYNSMECVRELAHQGLIDGVEIDHPRNTEEDKAELYKLALDNNLIITGGTDFHGINTTRLRPLGTCLTEADQVARIEALAKSRKE